MTRVAILATRRRARELMRHSAAQGAGFGWQVLGAGRGWDWGQPFRTNGFGLSKRSLGGCRGVVG